MDKVIQNISNQIVYLRQLRYNIPRHAETDEYIVTPAEIDQWITNSEDLLDRLKEIKNERTSR